jgi:hypothetical protein
LTADQFIIEKPHSTDVHFDQLLTLPDTVFEDVAEPQETMEPATTEPKSTNSIPDIPSLELESVPSDASEGILEQSEELERSIELDADIQSEELVRQSEELERQSEELEHGTAEKQNEDVDSGNEYFSAEDSNSIADEGNTTDVTPSVNPVSYPNQLDAGGKVLDAYPHSKVSAAEEARQSPIRILEEL